MSETVAALSEWDRPAILAGGTDLPAQFNEGFQPGALIDISRIAALRTISIQAGAIIIGAAVTHAAGATDAILHQHLPAFAAAWSRISNVRIRLSATLGGNVMARRTRYEGALLLTALGAQLRFVKAAGQFEMPVENIWEAAPPSALLTAIVIPLRPGLRLSYDRSMRPIATQAAAIDAAGEGRLVTATEHVRPHIVPIRNGSPIPAGTPIAFGDPVTSDAYLNRLAAVLAARHIKSLGPQ